MAHAAISSAQSHRYGVPDGGDEEGGEHGGRGYGTDKTHGRVLSKMTDRAVSS